MVSPHPPFSGHGHLKFSLISLVREETGFEPYPLNEDLYNRFLQIIV